MQLLEIVVPLALGACAGWLSAIGWRPLAVVMVVLVLLWCGVAALSDVPALLLAWENAATSVAEQITAIGEEREALERTYRDNLATAKYDEVTIRKANKEYQDGNRDLSDRLKVIIRERRADPAAFDGITMLVDQFHHDLDEDLIHIVLHQHITHPDMGKFCFQIRRSGPKDWVRRIASAAAEKHPNSDIRGQAVFVLGDSYKAQTMPPYDRNLGIDKRDILLAKAAQFYEDTLANYGKAPTPDGETTLGEKARHELARIRNLPNLKVGRPAPPITGQDLDGNQLRLEDFRGKVVVVVFWGSWCGPCMSMVPHERELHERYRDKPFALLGINCGDTLEKARATAEENRMLWPSWWDGNELPGPIVIEYNVMAWPRIFVINPKGIITAIGVRNEWLEKEIDAALTDQEDGGPEAANRDR